MNKKNYEEAKIEFIRFSSNDILTDSNPIEINPGLGDDTSGDIKTPEIEF